MDATTTAIELTEAAWEQWVGAVLRAERLCRLTATGRAHCCRPVPAQVRPRTRGSLLWMLAVSVAGFMLLR